MIFVLAMTGSRIRGPIADLMVYSSQVAEKAEQTIVAGGRKQTRADKLTWFVPIAADKAKLLSPGRMLLGAYDNEDKEGFGPLTALEDTLRTTFPIVHIYSAWGDKIEEGFPALRVKQIRAMGSVPLITWEPWLTDFDAELHPGLKKAANRDPHGLRDIARGDYDFYLRNWAEAAAASGGPIFIRVGHEMNDPYRYPWGPQNNSAKEFVAAWRHIRSVFKNLNANNVVWVWSPHPAYGWFDAYYPGADQVDYVGLGTLNYGTVANWSQWWSFDEIFGKYYPQLAKFKKPIMLTEFGTLAVGGDRASWYRQALQALPVKYPAVSGVVFFHVSIDNTTTQQTLNWYIKNDVPVARVVRDEIAKMH